MDEIKKSPARFTPSTRLLDVAPSWVAQTKLFPFLIEYASYRKLITNLIHRPIHSFLSTTFWEEVSLVPSTTPIGRWVAFRASIIDFFYRTYDHRHFIVSLSGELWCDFSIENVRGRNGSRTSIHLMKASYWSASWLLATVWNQSSASVDRPRRATYGDCFRPKARDSMRLLIAIHTNLPTTSHNPSSMLHKKKVFDLCGSWARPCLQLMAPRITFAIDYWPFQSHFSGALHGTFNKALI